MPEHTSKFSVFSKIVTSSLLVLSYTFVESWDSVPCQENAVRTSRLLTGHTLIGNVQGTQYPYLKNKLIELLDEENDASGKSLNYIVHDGVCRNTFSNPIHEDNSQQRSYRNLDASFDHIRRTNEMKRRLQKESKGTNDSLDIDCFHDDEESSRTPSSMALERYDKSRCSRKYLTSALKKRTSSGSIQFDYKPEENFETLKKMVMKVSGAENPFERGFIGALQKFDKKFEIELLRSVNDKALSDYDECRYKTAIGKYKHFMKKFRVFLPPTMNMAILMLMLVFQSLFIPGIFTFLSFTFFSMMSYYGYKFAKINKMKRHYRNFVKTGRFRKPIEYQKNYYS
ncbi:Uncharacterized protein PCOAH_00004060 [Plasmodium coatneyi]|uniref:Pv-fam-d protein n=1 Tax=Plasmodium coatneyi TaxID=208452 RepID=A0A1B1DTN3_9APIC|nr:Uncharacterized protein PCOAH_00004060 [Plasmodium coatneyi]ANQ06104.1 Uncharacterized protein PCOAH_00004060 [Plasmodium coatneyi]